MTVSWRQRGGVRRRHEPMKRCLACEHLFDAAGWRCPNCGRAPEPGRFPSFLSEDSSVDYVVEAYDDEQWLAFEAANAFWFRPRARLIGNLIHAHFGAPGSFLEVGCGAGGVMEALSARFPEMRIVGGEPAGGGLAIAARRVPQAELLLVDALSLPFRAEFDVVGAFDVLEHLEDDRGAISEIAAATRPGGLVIISVPQHPRLWSRYDEAGGHHRRYTRRDLLTKLEAGGLRVECATSFVMSLLPGVAWSRYRANRARDYDVVAFDSRPKPGSRLLEWVLEREVALIARGVSLPVGSSLVVAARRV